MTHRERVMAALNFRQPDRVPIDFNAHRLSGISVAAYRELRKYLDLPPSPLYVYDLIQQLVIIEKDGNYSASLKLKNHQILSNLGEFC